MKPCYVDTYAVKGPCAVNVNSIASKEDQQLGCLVHFNDGSQVQLVEACEAIDLKAPYCTPHPTAGIPVYG